MPIEFEDIKLYSVDELAKLLKININTVRIFCRKGKLKGKKIGTRWYVEGKNIKKFLEKK